MKLLAISFGTLLLSAMLWTTLWFWGKSLTYKPYDHVLTNWSQSTDQPLLALSTDDYQEAKHFLEKNPDGVLQLNLKVSSEGNFFTAKPGALGFISKLPETNLNEYKGNKHFYYSFVFLKNLAPDIIAIDTWKELKPHFWIFNIEDNALDVDKHVVQYVEKNDLQDKVVITSDTDIVISSLKDQRPLWVYGSSLSDLTKLLTMASINLEALVNLKRDYFFTPVTLKKRDVLNSKVIAEVKRRFKKVAIGPVHTDQDRARALQEHPDILILSSRASK